MKVVVIGGTGLIGSKAVAKLNQRGHEAVAAAPSTGVNTLTGEGLANVLTGAQVVIDVATYAETAAILDIPMGTVMSRASRGRQRLRIALAHVA